MADIIQDSNSSKYSVLARKYRPATFSEIIGQEALVRTVTNAITTGKLAHAYMLTGVRGVGKTTTARIIAKALNCVGADGKGEPTVNPCGVCEYCKAITEDRLMDVQEMDAASRTGVDDIREILEGVRYRPASARFKIYVIDEVHMLSKNAFNALLKTLEEPPEHVKFIFATTEIRKVPVTVLSRCQRFDLRRVSMEVLTKHYASIATKENVHIEEKALHLIAKAADGSVRDGLSVLDQAIVHGKGTVTAKQIREMVGLVDRTVTLDLFDYLMSGNIKEALELFSEQYVLGANPLVVVQDLMEITHWLTRMKAAPFTISDSKIAGMEKRCSEMSQKLSMAVLARTWQMLLKGLKEAQFAPSSLQAVEMLLIRISYVADLPTPEDTIKKIQKEAKNGNISTPVIISTEAKQDKIQETAQTEPESPQPPLKKKLPESFEEVVVLFDEKKEAIIANQLKEAVHLVRFEQGTIEVSLESFADKDLALKTAKMLSEWTNIKWNVYVSSASKGEITLKEKTDSIASKKREDATENPIVKNVLETFNGSCVTDVKTLEQKTE